MRAGKKLQSKEHAKLNKIKSALKHALKQKNLKYKDIAQLWDCSEITVKRLLGAEELPTSRLLSLLEFLGLTLKELHALTELGELGAPKWTARQNEFLAKNPKIFAFLVKLYEGGPNPQAIAKKYRIGADELQRILIQLEKYDLIRVGTRGEVKPWYPRMPNLEGRLGAAQTTRILDRVNTYLKAHVHEELGRQLRGLERENRGSISFHITELTEKTYAEFAEKFQRLHLELESAAKIEENSKPKSELKPVVSVLGFIFNKTRRQDFTHLEDTFAEDLLPAPKDALEIPRGL